MTKPRAHTNPAGEIDLLIDYATEKLNLIDGRTTNHERDDRGTLLKIARHVPRSLLNRAMADTQDANQAGRLDHAGKYFSARITALCVQAGIRSPFAQEKAMATT